MSIGFYSVRICGNGFLGSAASHPRIAEPIASIVFLQVVNAGTDALSVSFYVESVFLCGWQQFPASGHIRTLPAWLDENFRALTLKYRVREMAAGCTLDWPGEPVIELPA